ncbi:flagellar basal body-associated protein FliL [Bacillus alveayuensis]|jgi:flagellar protein FliL|uniref:flagellar basal body-associated protein FliL n=1 Tax=Aeribacillus alveayuensis TaxID=279215 RepID=UPI0005D12765|nr:flagellar basal body-associated protein FliL [Bacillus alveayuensis]
MNKKILTTLLIIITSISIIGIAALYVIQQFAENSQEKKEPTIDEVLERTVEVPEITTNLASNNIVQLTLKIETTNKKAKKELEKRDFQVRDIVIFVLSDMKASELEGQNGMNILKEKIKNRINGLMQNGEVKEIYITSFILQ